MRTFTYTRAPAPCYYGWALKKSHLSLSFFPLCAGPTFNTPSHLFLLACSPPLSSANIFSHTWVLLQIRPLGKFSLITAGLVSYPNNTTSQGDSLPWDFIWVLHARSYQTCLQGMKAWNFFRYFRNPATKCVAMCLLIHSSVYQGRRSLSVRVTLFSLGWFGLKTFGNTDNPLVLYRKAEQWIKRVA